MSHLRKIVPFEPVGEMKSAVDAIHHEFGEVMIAIDNLAPSNINTEVAKILLEVSAHYVNAAFAAYATGTPNEMK